LLQDKAFMTQLLEKDASLFRYASGDLRVDDDLALIAFAGPRESVELYLQEDGNDNNRRRDFAKAFRHRLRVKLDTHDAFCKIFVFGMTDSGSLISGLSQGVETSTGYKKLIAEFVGLPIGKELSRVRRADDNFDAMNHLLPTHVPAAPRRTRLAQAALDNNLQRAFDHLVLSIDGHDSESPQAPINRRGPRRHGRP